MGWKSTLTLSREVAISILSGLYLSSLSNEHLADLLDPLGDDPESGYYGHNFVVHSTVTGKEPDNDVS